MKRLVLTVLISIFCFLPSGCTNLCPEKVNQYSIKLGAHSAVTPVSRNSEDWWKLRFQNVLNQTKQGKIDMIFIGDSITHAWEDPGKEVWQHYYAKRNAVNMGYGGDRTQHTLWLLQNGEIDGINPKLAVIMIGTNNSNGNDNTSREIGEGIIAICQQLRSRLPHTKILILAIFPRGTTYSRQRQKNAEAGMFASAIADNKWIYYLDIGDKFLDSNGTLTKDIMPDYLHPNAAGYRIWAEEIEPTVAKLMGEK